MQSWREDLYAGLGQGARLVYRGTEQFRLLGAQLQAPMCPVLVMGSEHHEFLCASRQPLLDLRRFEYGWEVYQGPCGLKP